MKFLNTLALIGFAVLGSNAMRNIPSKELIKDIKIGWNLGNTLDAHCLDKLNYAQDQTASETCWGNPKATSALFKKLNQEGFNIFRIPTTWTGHFGEGPEYKIDATWMKRVHEVVDYALDTGSYAILNIHHENWNYAFSNNLEAAKPILAALWTQIATEFANYDEHLIFEGMNEPRKVGSEVEWSGDKEGCDFVNEMNTLFIKTVRGTSGNNAIRHLMIPTYAAAVNDEVLGGYNFPSGDDKIIASVHSYTPYDFALAVDNTAISVFDNTQPVDWAMNNIKRFLVDKNVPVIIGEFGAMNRNNDEERFKWAEYFVKSATALGVPCVLWDNGIFEGDGELFGIIDRTNLTITYPLYVEGMMSGLAKGSNNSSYASTANVATANVATENINSQAVQYATSQASQESSYLSCAQNDMTCKSQMSEKCFNEVSNCFRENKDLSKCTELNNLCGKIWN